MEAALFQSSHRVGNENAEICSFLKYLSLAFGCLRRITPPHPNDAGDVLNGA